MSRAGLPIPPLALVAALVAATPGSAGDAEELRVAWIAADGSIVEESGAVGIHGLAGDGASADGSPARFRIVLDAPPGPPSVRVSIASVPAAGGRDRDTLHGVPLEPLGDGRCATPWLIAVASLEDRRDPDLAGRAIHVRADDWVEARVRLGGGRAIRSSRPVTRPEGEEGPLALRRVDVEVVVLRSGPGGAPLVGGDEAGAADVMRFQAEVLGEVLAPCAIWAGPPGELSVRVADPSLAALIAIGDPLGLPSGGGEVRLEIDGKRLAPLKIGAGYEPGETARVLAAHIRDSGFAARASQNARNPQAAHATADVVVSRPDGTPAQVRPWDGSPVTTDDRQPVRIGGIYPGAGLDTYGPNDSASGTIEERGLLKVLGREEPGAITVFVVDGLADGRKLGEALLCPAGTGSAGAVFLDWRALWRTRQAYTLPHEIAHLLLGDLGHTDERGDPRPELLMHSRASSAWEGPRRLTAGQCGIIRRSLERGLSPSS